MKEISFAFPIQYGQRAGKEKYLPAIIKLNNSICKCYGIGWPRNYSFTNEPKDKFCLTKISTYTSRYIIRPIQRLFKFPSYYIYWSNIIIFDLLYSNKIANDSSKIVFTHPLLNKTIEKSKEKGKIVIVEAPNSEPQREHTRIVEEYKIYNIHKHYIYGNKNFCDSWLKGYEKADKVISISKVSLNTYLQAGYEKGKFKLIPLTGSEFVKNNKIFEEKRQKAFITTAQHSFIKGTHRLLQAWKKAAIRDIPLYVVGSIGEDLKEFIEKYGPFEDVIFTGYKSNISEFYEGIEGVGVLLSLSEGAVRVTPEMMAYGYPMITTVDASCDLIENGKNGFIVDVYDEEALVSRLKYVADNWSDVMKMKEDVMASLKGRTVGDFSQEVGDYLLEVVGDLKKDRCL